MMALVHSLRERRRQWVRPFLLGELLVVFALLRVYDYVKSLESVRMSASLSNGREVLSIEQSMHIAIEGSANHWLAHHHTMATLLVWWYQYSHITGTMAVLACCYLWFPQFYRSARNSLALTNCVGMLVFVLLPVMPPRLLPHAGFIDSVAVAGFGVDHGGPVEPAQFAAMPSLHLAWAMWVAIVLFAMLKGRSRRGLVFMYPLLTAVAVIATGNHYVLDVVAGIALAVGTIAVCGFLKFVRVPVLELHAQPAPVAALES
jgi:membrane-associated phospholipid phosphatase